MNDNASLIEQIQTALRQLDLPAWLFYGFRDLDPIALRILRFPEGCHATRRWFYLVPREGEPIKLVHRIEPRQLDHLPGRKEIYLEWPNLQNRLQALLAPFSRVAMQYSPSNAIPYVSRVDAGTLELIRSCGPEVVSSADLVQLFEAVWSPDQIQQHRQTARQITTIVQEAFAFAAKRIREHGSSDELEVQEFILSRFREKGLICDSPPIVGVNQHSGDPHYSPTPQEHSPIRAGDFLLIDLWAKPDQPDAVYADITWTACFGSRPQPELLRVFQVVREGRDQGVDFLQRQLAAGRSVQGWEVDDVVREVIREAGYGQYFIHRTGHNLGSEVHGNGVNFDNLETHDTRTVMPGLTCTIEPGIYLEGFGVRSEINVHIQEGGVELTTPPQRELLLLDVS